jgi:hypothetical protein
MLGLLLLACAPLVVRAQKRETPLAAALSNTLVEENANLDVELYLLTASDTSGGGGGRLPSQLEPVVRQLRATLPFENYRLTATMLNRTRNGGRLEVKGVGATPFSKVAASVPLFSEYSVASVKLKNDAIGPQSTVELAGFRFGARIPIQMSSVAPGAGSAAAVSTIQYESTGISTEFSMREGEPVIVGTLSVGQSGETFILVVSAKRTGSR